MPTVKTRRLLKEFGIAVTEYEDAIGRAVPAEKLRKAEAVVRARLKEVTALIGRLRAKRK